LKKHVKTYLTHFGYGEQDYIPSEVSGLPAVDIHHLIFRSHGGDNSIHNLMALTREEHERAHQDPEYNEQLKLIHKRRLL